MDRDELADELLKRKKKVAKETAERVCKKNELPVPTINFSGSDEKWNELAHYHPESNTICISKRQLYRLKTEDAVRRTIIHELAHILEHEHGGKHKKLQGKFGADSWVPPKGSAFVSGEEVNIKSEIIRNNPELLARVNAPSSYTNFMNKDKASPKQEVTADIQNTADSTEDNDSNLHKPAKKNEIEELQGRLLAQKPEKPKKVKAIKHTPKKAESNKKTTNTKEKTSVKPKNDGKLYVMTTKDKEEAIKKVREDELARASNSSPHKRITQEKESIEAVRTRLGIDLNDKSHIKSKKKGIFSKIKEMLGF